MPAVVEAAAAVIEKSEGGVTGRLPPPLAIEGEGESFPKGRGDEMAGLDPGLGLEYCSAIIYLEGDDDSSFAKGRVAMRQINYAKGHMRGWPRLKEVYFIGC